MSKNFHWYHTLIISLLSLGVFILSGYTLVIFDYIFVIGIIFTIIHFFKERKKIK